MESPREIEWDEANAEAHLAKHGVPFDFAARVFLDPGRADFDASHPEDGETRRKAVGMIEGKLYTVYAHKAGVARIISARRANAQETRRYA